MATYRSVKVHFENGDYLTTSMAGHLSDDDIRDYYRIGKTFNVGLGPHDNLTKVSKVEILPDFDTNEYKMENTVKTDFRKGSLLENYNRIVAAKNQRLDERGPMLGVGFVNKPEPVQETLEAGGQRLFQLAEQMGADFVLGEVIRKLDESTAVRIADEIQRQA